MMRARSRVCKCGSEKFVQDRSNPSGDIVCAECGLVFQENPIVSEVQFGETSSGGAMVQGSMVGADQSRAALGGRQNAMGSREQTLINARRRIKRIAAALHIPDHIIESAHGWFKLALTQNFVQGRRSQNVLAACLYIACRKERTHHMLIDFSIVLQISVFSLGATFLKMVKAFHIDQLPLADPSLFIQHYAERLHFGDKLTQVVRDAVKLAERMANDWLEQGRRPAGVAGACLLIAARMNNFRRTHTEIVAVAHVASETIQRRLNEFKQTGSGKLKIKNFRESDEVPEWTAPPSFLAARKRERRLQSTALEQATRLWALKKDEEGVQVKISESQEGTPSGETEDQEGNEPSGEPAGENTEKPTEEPEGEQDGEEPEEEPTGEGKEPSPVGRVTRSRKRKQPGSEPEELFVAEQEATPEPDAAPETAPEAATEELPLDGRREPTKPLPQPKKKLTREEREQQEQDQLFNQIFANDDLSESVLNQELARIMRRKESAEARNFLNPAEQERLDRLEEIIQTNWPRNLVRNLETSEAVLARVGDSEIGSDDDDDEVDAILLTEDEAKIKENVWVGLNQDYITEQERKRLKQEADMLAGNTSGTQRKKRKPRAPKTETDEQTIRQVIQDQGGLSGAAESAGTMLAKKAFSKKLNYKTLDNLFKTS
ncbi:transcription factor IIIB 70 kDa subunit [Diutina catenulata]